MLARVRDSVSPGAVAAVVLCMSAVYAWWRFDAEDSARCRAVERTGWWDYGGDLSWQVQGCTLRQYSARDVQVCLQGRADDYVLFIGDSAVRNKFQALAQVVDPRFRVEDGRAHADIELKWPGDAVGHVAARFLWDPYLRRDVTRQVLAGAYNDTLGMPRAVVLGAGAWFLRFANESDGLGGWRRTADAVARQIRRAREPEGAAIAEHVFVSPVGPVVAERLAAERRATLDPERMRWMNAYMAASGLPVFGAWHAMAAGRPGESADGLHYSARLEARAAGALLNRICNERVLGHVPPFRTTCCFRYPRPGRAVAWAAGVTAGAAALWAWAARAAALQQQKALHRRAETLRHVAQFGAVLLVMYACDRTPLLEKLQKHFVGWEFGVLLALGAGAGAATWAPDARPGGFLGRAQTDEWKGWMQIVILAYHAMNASGVAVIYNPVRVLVAMYLFMTGYGHCSFFCAKADFGLRRLTAVLLRTNVLAVGLAYVMGTSYMDYYFAPLSSAWVLIVWATMRVAPAANNTPRVWAKIAASAAAAVAVNRLHLWPFALLARLGVAWSAAEWEFRFGTDIFIVYVGMAAAVVVRQHGAQLAAHARWPQMQRWAAVAALAGLAWYAWFEATRPTKFAYNAWHPYVSWVPTLAFVVLRNATPYLRARSSGAFRFAGLISLELFIAQFHLLLAADTKAVLVLVDSRLWWLNLAVVAAVFVALCRVLSASSAAICAWLMAPAVAPDPAPVTLALPMAELPPAGSSSSSVGPPAGPPSAGSAGTTLDRLAAGPPLAARLANSLAVRWAVGLGALLLLNRQYV